MTQRSVLEDAVDRRPLSGADGKSGAAIDRVTMPSGEVWVVKHVDPAADWVMASTRDPGRVATLHEAGVFDRLPEGVDSAIIAVETAGGELLVVMRDVSAAAFADDVRLSRDDSRRLLAAAGAIHSTFADCSPDEFGGLCELVDLYAFLSPRRAQEMDPDHDVPQLVQRGWERFADVVPSDVAVAVENILDDPREFADTMAGFPSTLCHGDFKLANLGMDDTNVVVLDWGALTCWAPPSVEYAWYLAINAASIDATLDELLFDAGVASRWGGTDEAMPLALLGALVQLGWDKALSATGDDRAANQREREALTWWISKARAALELWSPS